VLVIVDVSGREGFPTDAYFAVEEIKDDGTSTSKTFVHTPSTIEAEEAEEIGVEHLLRDIRDVAVGTLSTRVTAQLQSLQGLHIRLREIGAYLQKVLDGELPVNHAILGNLQDIFNLLPNISTPPASRPNAAKQVENSELARAMRVKTNDQLMTIYLSSLVRAITAFHDLIDNKIQNRQQAEEQEAKKDEEKEKKDGEKEEKKAAGVNGEAKKDAEEDPKPTKGKKKS
jgi:26S proteasome regulatory subunit N8